MDFHFVLFTFMFNWHGWWIRDNLEKPDGTRKYMRMLSQTPAEWIWWDFDFSFRRFGPPPNWRKRLWSTEAFLRNFPKKPSKSHFSLARRKSAPESSSKLDANERFCCKVGKDLKKTQKDSESRKTDLMKKMGGQWWRGGEGQGMVGSIVRRYSCARVHSWPNMVIALILTTTNLRLWKMVISWFKGTDYWFDETQTLLKYPQNQYFHY